MEEWKSGSDESIRIREERQIGDAAFCQITFYTCYFSTQVNLPFHGE